MILQKGVKLYRFAYPQLLFLLFVVIICGVVAYKKKPSSITFSQASRLKYLTGQTSVVIVKLSLMLRILSLVFIVIAFARPQKYNVSSETKTSGVDIILCLDTSGSMRALDFTIDEKRVTRLDAVKHVVNDFVKKRMHDRIGLVVFGEKAFTQCPLTLDKGLILNLVKNMEIGMAGDSTAIGLATALAAKRLKDIDAKSKIIILLTDGINNAGGIDPVQAAEAASAIGIKIYAIGVGGFEPVPFVVDTVFGQRVVNKHVDLDEETLKHVANKGEGKYFHASDTQKLKEIYGIIDGMETTDVKVKQFFHYEELYRIFLIPSLIILLFDCVIRSLFIRRLP